MGTQNFFFVPVDKTKNIFLKTVIVIFNYKYQLHAGHLTACRCSNKNIILFN